MMLNCWACGYVLKGEPDDLPDPEEEQAQDLVATCPECLTRHVYIEDEDGNMSITQAVKSDGSVLDKPSA